MSGLFRKLNRIVRRLNGDRTEYTLGPYHKALLEIKQLDSCYRSKSDDELLRFSRQLQVQMQATGSEDSLVVSAFALVRETIRRQLNLEPFDEQLLAGLAMQQGKVVDMKTGEGKTLAAIFPVYAAALMGKGVQVLTFNDYLAGRDARWTAPVFNALGISNASIHQSISKNERQLAYNCDVCYLTAKEFGFDYLRDGLCTDKAQRVQRKFNFVLIDEADSLLIDEARVPLVIAGSSGETSGDLFRIAEIVKTLDPDLHLAYDEYKRNLHFTDAGLQTLEETLKCGYLFDEGNIPLVTQLQYAAHAQYLLQRDVNYILAEDQIHLVDEFTGRRVNERRWPDGLHDAVEAKEQLLSKRKGTILNLISLQDLCQLIPKLAGMSGTALPGAAESQRFYNLVTVVIPTHNPCIRQDLADNIFVDTASKNKAILEEVRRLHLSRRPVLVGTSSVAESALLAEDLRRNNIPHRLLNARNPEQEAEIIAGAGGLCAVTISTNMAGRGTDIVLGCNSQQEMEQVKTLGGLHVIGSNRHESERVDQQLRGRAGRQGDPGSSQFFVSLEDPLYERYRLKDFISEKLQGHLQISVQDGQSNNGGEITNPGIRPIVNRLQRVIEGQNLEIKNPGSVFQFQGETETAA